MIEIRACTPDNAAAVSILLSELGYKVPIHDCAVKVSPQRKGGVRGTELIDGRHGRTSIRGPTAHGLDPWASTSLPATGSLRKERGSPVKPGEDD